MTNHPTDQQIDEAIKKLRIVIQGAENSNHSGEVALMKAVAAIAHGDDAFPSWKETLKARDGGQAFPPNYTAFPGMTLRQYYAGQAIVGLISYYGKYCEDENLDLTKDAFAIADAMIKEGNKP